jgi:glycosyltransferase involved in cell wall biosynthesis
MPPLRICALSRTTVWHGMSGGMDIHGMQLAHGLAAAGHRVTILATRHPDGRTSERHDGIEIHFLADTQFGARRHGWGHASARRFAELHAGAPFDLVWSQSFDAFGLAHRRGALPPLVATIHGSLPQEIRTFATSLRTGALSARRIPAHAVGLGFSYLVAQRPVLARAARVIAVCDRVRRDLQRWFGGAVAAKCVVVPNGIDTSRFVPDAAGRARCRAALDLPADAPVLLSLGRLTPEKGHHVALEAVAQLRRGGVPALLLVVGDGPHADALRAAARRLELADAARFIGPVPHDATAEYYNCADALLMPTLTVEGLPFVLLEAMACGTPVIASDSGGVTELVRPGCTGLLVPPGDAAALAREAAALLRAPDFRARIAAAALRAVRSGFSLEAMIHAATQVMESVATPTGR